VSPHEQNAMPHAHGAWAVKLRGGGFTPVFEFWTHAPAPRERVSR